jgi:hypothetical protein
LPGSEQHRNFVAQVLTRVIEERCVTGHERLVNQRRPTGITVDHISEDISASLDSRVLSLHQLALDDEIGDSLAMAGPEDSAR